MFSLLLACLFGVLLVGVVGWRHPRQSHAGPSLLFLLLLFFPLLWAAALWVTPMGPPLFGAALVPAVLAGLLIALVIAVLTAPAPRASRTLAQSRADPTEAAEADAAATAFGVMFWVLLVAATGAVIAGYML